MNGLVKNVFLLIMGCTVALVLYVLLFGATNWEGAYIDVPDSAGYHGTLTRWKGVLWYAAEAIEIPIARYYQAYCIIPTLHKDDYVDQALGGTLRQTGDRIMTDTPSDLSVTDPTVISWPSSTSGRYHDSGWY